MRGGVWGYNESLYTLAMTYRYAWHNNPKRETLYNRICRVLKRGKKNSILIEFEDGQREIVSRNAIRKQP
jgi:hypothetical protein